SQRTVSPRDSGPTSARDSRPLTTDEPARSASGWEWRPDLSRLVPSAIARPRDPIVATGRTTDRVPALDFTKGALVLFMVLYHWLNYFVSPQGEMYRY